MEKKAFTSAHVSPERL